MKMERIREPCLAAALLAALCCALAVPSASRADQASYDAGYRCALRGRKLRLSDPDYVAGYNAGLKAEAAAAPATTPEQRYGMGYRAAVAGRHLRRTRQNDADYVAGYNAGLKDKAAGKDASRKPGAEARKKSHGPPGYTPPEVTSLSGPPGDADKGAGAKERKEPVFADETSTLRKMKHAVKFGRYGTETFGDVVKHGMQFGRFSKTRGALELVAKARKHASAYKGVAGVLSAAGTGLDVGESLSAGRLGEALSKALKAQLQVVAGRAGGAFGMAMGAAAGGGPLSPLTAAIMGGVGGVAGAALASDAVGKFYDLVAHETVTRYADKWLGAEKRKLESGLQYRAVPAGELDAHAAEKYSSADAAEKPFGPDREKAACDNRIQAAQAETAAQAQQLQNVQGQEAQLDRQINDIRALHRQTEQQVAHLRTAQTRAQRRLVSLGKSGAQADRDARQLAAQVEKLNAMIADEQERLRRIAQAQEAAERQRRRREPAAEWEDAGPWHIKGRTDYGEYDIRGADGRVDVEIMPRQGERWRRTFR